MAAAARGVRAPSSEHVLLALNADARARQVLLAELSVADLRPLVDERYPVTRGPIDPDQALAYAKRASASVLPPRPGPIPPVFERYSSQARGAIAAGEQAASDMMHTYVEPFYFLLGYLRVPGSVASDSLLAEGLTAQVGQDRARLCGPPAAHQATGIYTDDAREIVAESALAISHRMGHPTIGTGHLLLATLASVDRRVEQIIGNAAATTRISEQLSQTLTATDE